MEVIEKRISDPSPNMVRSLQLAKDERVIYLKRLRYIEGVPSMIAIAHIPEIRFARLLEQDLVGQPLNQAMEKVGHVRIIASQDHVEGTLARRDEAELLHIRIGAPILMIRGTVFSADGQPVRVTKSLFRADHFKLSISSSDLVWIKPESPPH